MWLQLFVFTQNVDGSLEVTSCIPNVGDYEVHAIVRPNINVDPLVTTKIIDMRNFVMQLSYILFVFFFILKFFLLKSFHVQLLYQMKWWTPCLS